EVEAAMGPGSGEGTAEAASEALLERGIRAGVAIGVRRGDELAPLRESDFVERVVHPVAGPLRVSALPLRFGRRPKQRFERPAPTLGEHNEEILGGLLGLSDAELSELAENEIIGTRPRGV